MRMIDEGAGRTYGGYVDIGEDVVLEGVVDPLITESIKEIGKRAAAKLDAFEVELNARLLEDKIVKWRKKRIRKKMWKEWRRRLYA